MTTLNITTLDELYSAFSGLHLEGGWHRKNPALWAEPRANFLPFRWRWSDVRPVLDAAGRLVSTEFAERRNLTMFNPVPGNTYPSVKTIMAAYQMMLPGETARCHRHTPNALRLVLEGNGTYTVVNGDRFEMIPGDVLLTPGWAWHAHGTEGSDSCYWVDYLDVPLVHMLEPMFFERHPDDFETDVRRPASSPMVFHYSETLRRLASAPPDPGHTCDRDVELGSPALKTLGLHMQQLDAGTQRAPYRTTANAVFTVVSGSGRSMIDDQVFDWNPGDTIAVPSWRPFCHVAAEDSVLFKVSDAPLMRTLGFLRSGSVGQEYAWEK